ncbi:MAG: hypothetical protein JWL88_540 [Parcubacteria group bacterium]|nr:hypothetical protein [Parcubacteria group bacterium]
MRTMRSISTKGFTLIELLVVIAIIGVLSSIVLSSLNTARNKGNDAAIKSNLEQARAQAELFYDSNNNQYVTPAGAATDVCSPTGTAGGVSSIYKSVLAAAQSSGLSTVNTSLSTGGATNVATCHACYSGQSGTNCTASGSRPAADRWAAESPLKSSTGVLWCVDSTGFVGTTTTNLAGSDAICG